MVNTGIEKYDKLPSRIGLKDVDALRYAYVKAKERLDNAKNILDKRIEDLNKVYDKVVLQ